MLSRLYSVGQLGRSNIARRTVTNVIKGDEVLSQQFLTYCNAEFNDCVYDDKTEMSQEDKRALAIMESTVQLTKDGHYEMALPWRHNPPSLPNNRPVATHRLNLLKRKLEKDDSLFSEYVGFIQKMIQSSFCEKIPVGELDRQDGMVWYLPHHAVYHPQKKKIRVVFDCSARYHGTSLNDQLLQGPDLTNRLVGVLLRFRQDAVAFMGDIEGMFHQVRVTPEMKDALRFLWWSDCDLSKEPEEYRMQVHLFGASSSPSCSNFALRRSAFDNEDKYDKTTVNTVLQNFYVDDCLKSVCTEDDAIRLLNQLIELLHRSGFRLTQISSNSRRVIESVPESERANTLKDMDFGQQSQLPTERALGMLWHMETDKFLFKVKIKDKPLTRRGVLSVASSLNDPIGFTAPVTLPVKSLMQELCKMKLGRDDEIPAIYEEKWRSWLAELPKLENIRIGRCFKPTNFGDVCSAQLHHFSDASECGYGAVSYLLLVNEAGEIHCSFIMAKSRVTPLKIITIPRLELAAATVAARLDRLIRNEIGIKVEPSYFWTDSTSVLKYIRNENLRFQVNVANRIAVIRDLTTPDQWFLVNGADNPADDASRGFKVQQLLDGNSRWLTGPAFLSSLESEWPNQPDVEAIPTTDVEVNKKQKYICTLVVTEAEDPCMMYFQRFSSWTRLKRCIAWILRFKVNLAGRLNGVKVADPITVRELRQAEKAVLSYVQQLYYSEELAGGKIKKSSSIIKLDPIMIDGLLCVGGRLRRSSYSDRVKHPIILPKSAHILDLIIQEYHEMYGHSGRDHILSVIRAKFWIVNGKSAIWKVLNHCYDCRRRHGKYLENKMADLPEERVTPCESPFTYVGVDFFGPFLVKQLRSQVKRYGCIFTCLSIRAVHIEICRSLDTTSFINGLRRFMARRGTPTGIWSDNGTNFVGGNRELREAIQDWNHDNIHDFLLQKEIEWHFNPPAASHMGGVWERQIRTVRNVLAALMKVQVLDDEGLSTLMCEVEAVINSRPITAVSDDPLDLEALTPNHLLLLRAGSTLPPGIFQARDLTSGNVGARFSTWLMYFGGDGLGNICHRCSSVRNGFIRNETSVGDLVIVSNEQLPRAQWPLGRVIEVHPGSDGVVRSAKIKTRSSPSLIRPVNKCVMLERAVE
ncbi:uncharacterized protein LOC141907778 [Tubulanus polymorphus]|uniref:uncharacterized protein LOC141907778 n=1 Tax=Tubulanus polymorphus TaxID=672921 RepID=UPI003DA30337